VALASASIISRILFMSMLFSCLSLFA